MTRLSSKYDANEWKFLNETAVSAAEISELWEMEPISEAIWVIENEIAWAELSASEAKDVLMSRLESMAKSD